LGIRCSFTSSAGTTGTTSITITARDWNNNLVATQTTTVFVVSWQERWGEGGRVVEHTASLCGHYCVLGPMVWRCLLCRDASLAAQASG
jgi:hypothetical protein